jgi:hypothetical protein
MSHPGQSTTATSYAGVYCMLAALLLVVGGFFAWHKVREAMRENDRERAEAALKDRLHRGQELAHYQAQEVERFYKFSGDRYVVRLSGRHYLAVPDYIFEILDIGRTVESALPEIRLYEEVAAGEPLTSLDEFKKLAVYEVRRKHILYPVTHLLDGRCIVRLTARGARRQVIRVTPQVFDVLVQGHAIRDQLPAIEAVLREHERKKATDE